MKQRVTKAFCLSFVLISLIAAQSVFADDQTVNLESAVVQTFDDPAGQPWFVIGSKFSSKDFPKVAYIKSWPLAVFGSNQENKDMRSLGISVLFDRKEYNWVDIVPGTKKGTGEEALYEPTELGLPGRVRMLDMWIWSGNFSYYLEAYVRDYTGIIHVLPMGDLDHIGWKNFRINVPNNIPQSKKSVPKREGLRLVKFRIWTRPTEVVAISAATDAPSYERAIYFYFDQLKVLTDTFETLYDGDALSNPKFIQDTWGTESTK